MISQVVLLTASFNLIGVSYIFFLLLCICVFVFSNSIHKWEIKYNTIKGGLVINFFYLGAYMVLNGAKPFISMGSTALLNPC